MQRFLTAAAVVSTMALATSGLALAQGATTNPSGAMNPTTAAPATATPSATPGMTPSSGMTNPSNGSMGNGSMGSPNATGPSAQNDTGMNAQSPRDIRQAQQQLKQQGLYRGRVDGKMGPETAQAISKFQQQNGLPQNSQLDQQTTAKLGGNGAGTGMSPGMSTNGSGSSTPPTSMRPSMSNPGAGSSVGSGGASTPSATTSMPNSSMPNATGTSTSH